MPELLITILTIEAIAALTGFLVWNGTVVISSSMDYPNPLWKIRFMMADIRTQNKEIVLDGEPISWGQYLNGALAAARVAPIEAKGEIMDATYQRIAQDFPGFKLWLCPFCMSIRIGLIVAGGALFIFVPLYGWWSALYFFSVCPFIGFFSSIHKSNGGE